MPDIRTLLDDVTTRTPAPDPVRAVHERVRRRAARRRAGVAAGTTMAIAATGLAAGTFGDRRRDKPPAGTAAMWPRSPELDVAWRRRTSPYRGRIVVDDPAPGTTAGLYRIVREHPDVFVGLMRFGFADADGVEIAFSADADPAAWADRVDAAADGMPWEPKVCDETAAHYDQVAREVVEAAWPPGDRLVQYSDPLYEGVSYEGGCLVVAEMQSAKPSDAAVEYAQARWGDDVVLVGRSFHEPEVVPPPPVGWRYTTDRVEPVATP